MSRRLRDKLPCASQTLQPQVPTDARKGLKKQKLRQIRYYRGAKPHHEFQRGDSVRIRRGNTWDKAIETSKHPTPRSYNIMTRDEREYRRNARMLNRNQREVILIVPPEISADNELEQLREPVNVRVHNPGNSVPDVQDQGPDIPDVPDDSLQTPAADRVQIEPEKAPVFRRSERQDRKPAWMKDYQM